MLHQNEYAPYFERYLKLILNKNTSIIDSLISSQKEFDLLLKDLPEEKQCFSYADGKWTIKELLQHIIDTERIFCYRALCFVRNDKTILPGFDQDFYINNTNSNQRNYTDLLNEMNVVRKGTVILFKSFSEDDLLKIGIASDNKISVRALGYLFSGHQIHHLNILKERYL